MVDSDLVQSIDSHSQTLPRGAVWSRFRCKLKSRPARSCLRWVLSMINALSGSRKRWSLPSAGPRVRGTPSPRGPERAVNILSSQLSKNALPPDGASSDPFPDTLTVGAHSFYRRDHTPRTLRQLPARHGNAPFLEDTDHLRSIERPLSHTGNLSPRLQWDQLRSLSRFDRQTFPSALCRYSLETLITYNS